MRFGPPVVVRVPTLKVMSPAGAAPEVSAVMCVPLAKVTESAVNVMAPGLLFALPPLIVVRTMAFSRNTVFAAVPPKPWIVIVPALPISPAVLSTVAVSSRMVGAERVTWPGWPALSVDVKTPVGPSCPTPEITIDSRAVSSMGAPLATSRPPTMLIAPPTSANPFPSGICSVL